MNETSYTCKTCNNSAWNTINGECEECYFKNQVSRAITSDGKFYAMHTVTYPEKAFLHMVKEFKTIGYGRMMQIISCAWHEDLERQKQGMGEGAHVSNTCLAFLSEEEKRGFLVIMQRDKELGMEY